MDASVNMNEFINQEVVEQHGRFDRIRKMSKVAVGNTARVFMAIGITTGAFAAVEMATELPAGAWQTDQSADANCVPNGANGEAIAELHFMNSEPENQVDSQGQSVDNTMIVTPVINGLNGVVATGDAQVVEPGQSAEWTLDQGSAPTPEEEADFQLNWENRDGTDVRTAQVPAVEKCCPPETTSTTTTTTTPETTTTINVATTTGFVATTTRPNTTTTGTVVTTSSTSTPETPPSSTTPNTLARTGFGDKQDPIQRSLPLVGLSSLLIGSGLALRKSDQKRIHRGPSKI